MTHSPQSVSPPPSAPAMPLMLARAGQDFRLAAIRAGQQLQQRLADMGLRPGGTFRVVAKDANGPLIILVGQTRLMLGQGMVQKMFVHPL